MTILLVVDFLIGSNCSLCIFFGSSGLIRGGRGMLNFEAFDESLEVFCCEVGVVAVEELVRWLIESIWPVVKTN